jgi:hypothetical protein
MLTPGEGLKEGCFGYSGPTPPHMSPYSNKALWLGLYPTQNARFTQGEDFEQGCFGDSVPFRITWALIPVKCQLSGALPYQVRTLNMVCFGNSEVPLNLTWALIPIKQAGWGFTLHKMLCLHQVSTLNRAVLGIQVPHLGPAL